MFSNFISAALIAAQIATGSFYPAEQVENTSAPEDLTYIIHAAGEIDSKYSTNSRQALRNAYADGNRIIEIDFSFTSDHVPVCIHDWNEAIIKSVVNKKAVSYEEYESSMIYGSFSPMSLDDVANFMMLYPDLYIVTDVKENNILFCGIIASKYPELQDRFIIQVYSEDQYMQVLNLGFDKIIFTLYELGWETKTNPDYIVAFSRQNPLFGITFPYELCSIDGYVETMLEAEVPLFVHTVNDKELQKKFFDMGITGIYTDNTTHE